MSHKKFVKPSKEDQSPVLPQRDKYKEELKIREYPWTDNQKRIIDLILGKESKIVFLEGPSGSGKTLISTYCGLKLLSNKRVSDYIFVRSPLETSDSAGLGYLPGSLEDRFAPYTMLLDDKLNDLLPKSQIAALFNDKRIQVMPSNYVRGASWQVRYIVVEECNNFTLSEFKLLLTRYGKFSKMIFAGCMNQCDLPKSKQGGFRKVFDWFNNEEAKQKGIHCFNLDKTDIKRSDITSYIIDKFDTNGGQNNEIAKDPMFLV